MQNNETEPEKKHALPKPASEGGEILQDKKDVWEKARAERTPEEQLELEKNRFPIEQEKEIQKQLRREIEMMELTPELQKEAVQKAKKIEFLGEKEKLEHLLIIAEEKGVEFAVRVAKEMNDPYVLDIFHDMLAKEGFYKKFSDKNAKNHA